MLAASGGLGAENRGFDAGLAGFVGVGVGLTGTAGFEVEKGLFGPKSVSGCLNRDDLAEGS